MPRMLLSCGEASGDLYGAELLRELRRDVAGLDAFGLGGDRVAGQGASLVAHVRDLAVVGLLEVLWHLRHLRRVFRAVLDEVDRARPDVAVLVDYADFNLRLGRALRRRGVPVVYYVSPQVWAWRRGRLRSLREIAARMLVIFPFEEEVYREAGVPVTFVGHPLIDLVGPPPDRTALARGLGLDPSRPVVALLPGSRRTEVAHNLPPIVGAVDVMRAERPDAQFVLAAAPTLDARALGEAFGERPVRVIADRTHDVLASADAAVVASGTATVEAALLGTPMVVVYRLSPWTYRLGRPFVRVPHYAMVNLIAGRRLVPELIQDGFTPSAVADALLPLLEGGGAAQAMRDGLAEVRAKLGAPGASARAAAVVREYLKK
jgi:lipid-A-disaccharide synthase